MPSVEVALVVACPDIFNPIHASIVMIEDIELRLPSTPLYNKRAIDAIAAGMLFSYTGLTAKNRAGNGWVQLVQSLSMLDTTKEVLYVPFGCMIPEKVALYGNASWVSMEDILNRVNKDAFHVDILQHTIRNL